MKSGTLRFLCAANLLLACGNGNNGGSLANGAGTGTLTGTGTISGTGTGIASSTTTATGTSSGTGTATGTSSGTGTATRTSSGTTTATGTSSTTSTASGTSTASRTSSGTSTATATATQTEAGDGGPDLPGWVLTWSDEFDGPDGSAVDPKKWTHDVGGSGWGNQELEYYTDGTQNAVVQGGNLIITATTVGASSFTCSYPSKGPCGYTSARLKTQGLFAQQYGRFEARIQLPKGQGLWPAFWMLGDNMNTAPWPQCGEIDIMENVGKEPSINHGSMHMPAAGSTKDDQLTGQYTLPGGAALGDDFHTYAIEWNRSGVTFYVDDNLYETQTPATASGRTWEFDHTFFLLLNVAVGGTFPGSPDGSATFPQTMKVDWVRVYEPADGG